MAKGSNESDVWKSCKRLDDGIHASCEICGEKLSCRGGSTSALRKQLCLRHSSASTGSSAGTSGMSSKISGYFGKAPLPMNRQLEE